MDAKTADGLAMPRVGRRQRVDYGPTPETAAKLQGNALTLLLRAGLIDEDVIEAADELAKVYRRVYGSGSRSMARAGVSDERAWIHARRFTPWMDRWSQMVIDGVRIGPAVIDLLMEGKTAAQLEPAVAALRDYQRIRKATPFRRTA